MSEHRNVLIWSFGSYAYDDPTLAAWASRVRDLLRHIDRLEAACHHHLQGDELGDALRSLARQRRRTERERLRRERDERFAMIHLPQEPPDAVH